MRTKLSKFYRKIKARDRNAIKVKGKNRVSLNRRDPFTRPRLKHLKKPEEIGVKIDI